MSSSILLSIAAIYSEDRINGSKVTGDCFITVDNLAQNKGGLTNTPVLPKGNLIAFSKGDILVGNIRPYLKKIWYADRNGGCSPDVLVFRALSDIDSKFLYYSLFRDDFFIHMMKGSKGTKMPRGDKNQTLRFYIPKFELTTQQKIASVLSALDSKIELNNRINAELEGMAKTLYDYWFVQFDFPDANGKPYKTSGGKMVWNGELKREIPEGWEVKKVDQILAKEDAKIKIPSSEINFETNIPVIDQSTNFISGYTNNEASKIDGKAIPRIVFGDHTRILKLINFDFARGADGTQVLLSNNDKVPQHYFYFSLLKIDLANYGYARHFKFLKDKLIVVPDLNSVTQFELKAATFYITIRENIFQNQKLTELRDWLLPMLMNGQVVVQ